ncbi:MAG: ferritin, partial [Lentisphaerae bacterium]
FLTEQVEEEKNVQDVIDQIVRMEKDPAAMMQLDKELGTRPLPVPVQRAGA